MIRRTFIKIAVGTIGGMAVQGVPALLADEPPATADFRVKAAWMRKQSGIVIGVLNDPSYAKLATPPSLAFENFRDMWGKLPNVTVVPLNKDEIRSWSILFEGHLDILVYPYGATYPMDAFDFYTGDAVLGFLKRGGAVLTTGGVPFGNPVSDSMETPGAGGAGGNVPNSDRYTRFVAALGYKYYQHPVTPPVAKADNDFLPSFPANSSLSGSPIGIVVNNSSHDPVPAPYHGNVFPERYPARQVTPLLLGTDKYGQPLATNGVLVQDFEDGSRRVHFSHTEAEHPLDPKAPWFPGLMNDVFALLTNRIVVKDVSTSYACYRDGEPVTVRAELLSFDPAETDADVVVEIKERESSKLVDTHSETVHFPSSKSISMEWKWTPASFDTDDYIVTVSIQKNNHTLTRGHNGFIVWKDAIAKAGPGLKIENNVYFQRSDGETFMLGTNYYESTRGEIMWFRPDVARLSSDLRQMRSCGVSYIRPHYHPQKWFKDYLLFQHQKLLPYFASLENVTDPLPDEAAWRIFDVFIYLCQKLGIAYGGDLFTLVPKEMGDPRGWFPMTEALVSTDARAVAKKFFTQINERYKDVPCILWDMWNEPGGGPMHDWLLDVRSCLATLPIKRYTTVGSAGAMGADVMDFVGLHIGNGGIAGVSIKNISNSAQPVMAQEVYLDQPEDLGSEMNQASYMRNAILVSVGQGLCGFAPWSWTRQMRLWQDSYVHEPNVRMESWDDRLGCQTHDDATLKPAGHVYKDLSALLKPISFVSYDEPSHTVKTTRGQIKVDYGAGSLFHTDGGDHCFAATALGSINWKGNPVVSGPKDANLYVSCNADDVNSTKKLYFKSDKPGAVKLFRSQPKSLALVELQPGVERKLDDLSGSVDGNAVSITIAPSQEAYWIAAEW